MIEQSESLRSRIVNTLQDRPLSNQRQSSDKEQTLQQTIAIINEAEITAPTSIDDLKQFIDEKIQQITLNLKIPQPRLDTNIKNYHCYYDKFTKNQPINMRKMLRVHMEEDDRKVKEILYQYQNFKKYEQHKQQKLLSQRCSFNVFKWLYVRAQEIGMQKVPFGIQPKEKFFSVIKSYSFNTSLKVVALLASNECIYFYNKSKRSIVGSRFFNKRHHQSKGIKFNPAMNNILVVWGESGLVVWNLMNLAHFAEDQLTRSNSFKQNYDLLFTKEGNYITIDFSHNGRYMACLKSQPFSTQPKNTSYREIEIYDFYNQNDYSIPTLLRKIGGGFDSAGIPETISFSPLDNFLAITFLPLHDTCSLKLYQFSNEKIDEWRFTFDTDNNYIRQVIWSYDESFALLHVNNTNKLHLMIMKSAQQRFNLNTEDSYHYEAFSLQSLFNSFVTNYFEPLMEKRELIYNIEVDPNFVVQEILKSQYDNCLVVIYREKKQYSEFHIDHIVQKKIALFNLEFDVLNQCCYINYLREIDFMNGGNPKCFYLSNRRMITEKDNSYDKNKEGKMLQLTYIDDERDSFNYVFIQI